MKNRCDQLGVCQARAECHVSCACPAQSHYPFAPGVIEGPAQTGQDKTWFSNAVFAVIFLLALVCILGFLAGYISVSGLLP